LAQAVPDLPTLSGNISAQQLAHWVLMAFVVVALAAALVRLIPRVWAAIEATLFSNWRLALLGSAALLLSAAGGWTTWDGMRNFTGESVLSAMFTFGIHGVMLIVAWLIGESFATGMNQVRGVYGRTVSPPMIALTVVGSLMLLAATAVYVVRLGISSDQALYVLMAAGAALLAFALLVMFSKSDVVQPYAQGVRIIAKNAMLWVMFLACMATSVFFSFDSRFNVIFPKDQRERAAEIRTKNQVAGVVSDIGDTISSRRITEAETLFQSEGWNAYEQQLAALSKASEGAEAEIESHFTRQMEAHRASIAEQQERIATATSGQAGLNGKKVTLTDELSRLKAERPALAAELATKKSELDARAKEVDAKRVEAMAEDKGVEGTLKEGRGPVYRQRMDELGRLKDYYKIGEERVKDAQKRVDAGDKRISEIERELAGVDGEIAKFRGEAETADQRIKSAEGSQLGQEGLKVDPARVRAAFERARADFRQQPDAEHLSALHQQCAQLYDAMISTDATKGRVRNIDCDPKQATEAAAVLFALNTGLKTFDQNCAGGEKIPETGGVDPLLNFGRKCLQDSGLPSKEASTMAAKLSAIDLNRDDKAHNFVVTLNAFQDGNRLAYLALAIAVGIDSLIFMTGLFGANAVRSPLSDVPSMKARNSQELNAMIETALLPDMFKKARLVAQAMHPTENIEGFSNEVRLDELDPETAVQVRDVLNAGAIIGAVRRHDKEGRYLVRSELLEFLNTVIKRELETNGDAARRGLELDQLEDQIRVALMPRVGPTCDFVMSHLDPINETNGFTSEVYLDQIGEEMQPPMLNVLNTGATFKVVQRDPKTAERYYIHKDLYKTLARIRAREHMKGSGAAQIGGPARGTSFGGALKAQPQQAIANQARQQPPSLTHADVGLERLGAEFRLALLKAMELDEAAYAAVARPEFIGGAVAAGKSLEHLKENDSPLAKHLRWTEKEIRDALQRTYQALWRRQGDDEHKIAALNAVNDEIESLVPALMLSPRGPYERIIRNLIDELQDAAGRDGGLDDDDQDFLERLREHASALSRVRRDTPDSWHKIGQLVFSLDEGDSHTVRSANA
jgi:peptidoglycan hydrolase CwlO-like protein